MSVLSKPGGICFLPVGALLAGARERQGRFRPAGVRKGRPYKTTSGAFHSVRSCPFVVQLNCSD